MISKDDVKIAIIGLGYVGLPLAAEFGKIRQVVGFDVNHKRILELKEGSMSISKPQKKSYVMLAI